MDPYDCSVLTGSYDPSWVEPLRTSLGYARNLADSISLTGMIPDTVRTSSHYCLAREGEAYLVYVPDTVTVTLNLEGIEGVFEAGWFDPAEGKHSRPELKEAGAAMTFTSPFRTVNNVLYLKKLEE
jgi:hypothetical protein